MLEKRDFIALIDACTALNQSFHLIDLSYIILNAFSSIELFVQSLSLLLVLEECLLPPQYDKTQFLRALMF